MGKHLFGGIALALAALACQAEPTQIGVVEQPQCAEIPAERARVMFVEAEGGWRSVNADEHAPVPKVEGLNWTIGFNGKALGRLTLKDTSPGVPRQSDVFFERDKLYKPFGKITQIPNPAHLFEGWCAAPTARPLVIVSKPQVANPAEWKAVEAAADIRHQLYPPLRLVLGRTQVMHCTDGQGKKSLPFVYKETDLIPGRAYRSRSGDMLLSIGLDAQKYGCDGAPGAEWSTHWFFLHQGEIDFIGNEMELVDAGDYAGDGKTEFLFWKSGYDNDGYVLIFDDLRQEVSYMWSYH